MPLRPSNCLIQFRLRTHFSQSFPSTSNIPVSVFFLEASPATTPFSGVPLRITMVSLRHPLVAFAPRPFLPLSNSGCLRLFLSTSHFSSDRALVPLRVPLRPPHMSSSQSLGDGRTLPDPTGFLFVEALPTHPMSFPSTGNLPTNVIDFSSIADPQQLSVVSPASVPVPFSPLVLSFSPVVLIFTRCCCRVAPSREVSPHN